MAVTMGCEILRGALPMHEAIGLLEKVFAQEAIGATTISPSFVTDFPSGSMRVTCSTLQRPHSLTSSRA